MENLPPPVEKVVENLFKVYVVSEKIFIFAHNMPV